MKHPKVIIPGFIVASGLVLFAASVLTIMALSLNQDYLKGEVKSYHKLWERALVKQTAYEQTARLMLHMWKPTLSEQQIDSEVAKVEQILEEGVTVRTGELTEQ